MFKKSFLIVALVVVSMLCAACPFDSNSSGSKAPPRDFYIESHEIYGVWRPCIYYSEDGGSGSDEIQEPVEEEDSASIVYAGHSYILHVEFFNDQVNTKWIAFEVFVDGERVMASGSAIPGTFKQVPETEEGGMAWINLFNNVPWNWHEKEVVVDVWLEDENGVRSEIYTFDVVVIPRIWYLDQPYE